MTNGFTNKMEELQYLLEEMQQNDASSNFTGVYHIDILLIEDSPVDAAFLKSRLSKAHDSYSYRIIQVKSLKKAKSLLKRHPFSVILLDLNLPDSEDSLSVMKLKLDFPTVPIVVLTGNDDYLNAIKSLRYGAQDYLVKGKVDGESISRAIHFAMNRK